MADKMMRIAGRGADGLAKAIKTENDGKLSVIDNNRFNTLINKQVTFSGKIKEQTYDIPHIAKTVVNSVLITPDSLKGLGAGEISQVDYDKIATENGITRSSGTITPGRMQIFYALFDVLNEAKKTQGIASDITVNELRNIIKKFQIGFKGYGVGANAGVKTWGIKLKAYNRTNLNWDEIGSNTASIPDLISMNLNANDYVDDTGFIYLSVHPTYMSDGLTPAENHIDVIKVDFVFQGSIVNGNKTPNVSEVLLSSVTVQPGQTVTAWSNVDISDCEQYGISIQPNLAHIYDVTSVPVGKDNIEVDEELTLIEKKQQGNKTSQRTTIRSPKVSIKITNHGTGGITYGAKLLKYSNAPSDKPIEIMGQREGDGLKGLAISYALDDDGIPVQRVVNAAPHAYEPLNDAIKTIPAVRPRMVVEELFKGVAVAPGGRLDAPFHAKGEDEIWVLINSDKVWSLTGTVGAWHSFNAGTNLPTSLYPTRTNQPPTNSYNLPAKSLFVIADDYGSMADAHLQRAVYDGGVYLTNNDATAPAIVSIRIMRVWRD